MIDAAAAKSLLSMLGMMAVQGTLLAIVALVLTRRTLRPAWQAAVWLVVIVKFVLPWSPALPFSLADLIAIVRGTADGGPIVVGAPTGSAPAATGASEWWLIAASVWLAGALLVIARALVAARGASIAARRAPSAPAEAQALLAEVGAPRRVRLAVSDIAGPHVVGLLRPIIVVPPSLLELSSAGHRELLRAALLHELAHVRRFDAVARAVQVVARAAFWWFPVVAFASRRLDATRESACDARALEASQLSRPAYARLLLQMAQLRAAAAPSLAARLDHRIDSVLGPPMRPSLHVAQYLALVAFGAVALGGARSAEARGVETCVYTAQLAEALRLAHPEADLDNDGVLSHDEACEFQAELRRAASPETLDQMSTELLAEPLCCHAEGTFDQPEASCRAAE